MSDMPHTVRMLVQAAVSLRDFRAYAERREEVLQKGADQQVLQRWEQRIAAKEFAFNQACNELQARELDLRTWLTQRMEKEQRL